MTQKTIKRIHQCYGWILTALIVAVGILCILACLGIYTSGPRPYSAESISIAFQRICIPVYIAILGIIGSILINLLLPVEKKRAKPPSRPDALLARLKLKAGILEISKTASRNRALLRIATAVIYALLMVYPSIYVLNPAHFTVSNLNSDIIRAVLIILLPAAIGLLLCWVCQKMINASLNREIALYKQAMASGQHSNAPTQYRDRSSRSVLYARIGILLLAAALIVLGIINGGVDDVLKKAIAICTECIGLG